MNTLVTLLVVLSGWPASWPGSPVVDFTAELDALSRGPACDGRPRAPSEREETLAAHCDKLAPIVRAWKDGWYTQAAPFFAELVPSGIPKKVVYPFGGADLLTALVVFPEAEEITIMALEPGGDPRSLAALTDLALAKNLKLVRQHFDFLSRLAFSRTVDLDELAKSMLAGVLIYDLAALSALGYEPHVLRYFRLGPTGGRLYYTQDDLARIDAAAQAIRDPARRAAFLAESFADFELRFRRRGADGRPAGREQTFRHISADLEDPGLKRRPELMLHLESKGRVSAMTKASSYLLWHTSFGRLRRWMLDRMDWMVSDSTGFAPDQIDPAVFEQLTWGGFTTPIITHPRARAKKMAELFKGSTRPMPFAFGYPDYHDHHALLVTRRR